MKFCAIFVLFSVGLLMSAEAGGGQRRSRHEDKCKDDLDAIMAKITELKEAGTHQICEEYAVTEKPASKREANQVMKGICDKFNKAENKEDVHNCIKDAAEQVMAGELGDDCKELIKEKTDNMCTRGNRRKNRE